MGLSPISFLVCLGAGTVLTSALSPWHIVLMPVSLCEFIIDKEGQIHLLLLPCEYCMPQIINFYLHIYYLVLYSNEIHYGTKSYHKMKPLYDELIIWTSSPFDPHICWYIQFGQVDCLSKQSSCSWLQSDFIKSVEMVLENFTNTMQSYCLKRSC